MLQFRLFVINPILIKKLKQHPVIQAVCQVSQQAETSIYLVGGAVRDLLIGIVPEKDFDFVSEDKLEKVARLFSKMVSGSLVRWSLVPPHYRVIFYLDNKRIEVDFSGFQGDDLCQDLLNRDFTVNAIALRPNDLFPEKGLRLYDPLEGEKDLQRKVLRTTSSHSFENDPLRILRAIRIAKARNLTIDPDTRGEISSKKARLHFVAAERIRGEFFKILSFPGAKDSLKLLQKLGVLSLILPEIEQLKVQEKRENLGLLGWEHSLETVKWCEWVLDCPGEMFPEFSAEMNHHFHEEIEQDIDRYRLLKLAGLLHYYEKSFPEKKGKDVIEKTAKRFKLSKRAKKMLGRIIENHLRVFKLFQMEKINPRVYFRLFQDLGPEGIDVLVLSWADFIASSPDRFEGLLDLNFRDFNNNLISYYFKNYLATSPQPLISGRDIIDEFGLQEGKVIGDLLRQAAEAEAEGLLSSREEAMLYIENLLKQIV